MGFNNAVDNKFSWQPKEFLVNSAGGQVAKQIAKKDPFNVANNSKSGFNAIGSTFGWSDKGSRQAKHYQEALILKAWLTKQKAIKENLEKYNSGKLNKGEQATVDKYESGEQAKLRQALASMGMSNSSASLAGELSIDAGAKTMKTDILETYWGRAMKLKGMKETSLEYISHMAAVDQNEKITNFDALMQMVGAESGIWTGGK
jgi:hypothetical protein